MKNIINIPGIIMKNLIVILLFSGLSAFGQQPGKTSLLIVEYERTEKGELKSTNLVSYNFIDGNYVSKDTIQKTPKKMKLIIVTG